MRPIAPRAGALARATLLAALLAAPALPGALAAQPQTNPAMQRSIDVLFRSLQEKNFALLAPLLDDAYHAPGLPPEAARQLLRQVVDGGMLVPEAVQVGAAVPEGEMVRVSAAFRFPAETRTLALLLTREGRFVEIPLFRVQMAPGMEGATGELRMRTGDAPAAPGGARARPPGADAPSAAAVPALREELRSMLERDQRQRREMGAAPDAAARRALAALDSAHTARLEEIVAAHGWPGRTLAGDDGAAAAMLILQHAGQDAQERLLPRVREAAARGEVAPGLLATLEDRVLMRQGRRQIYGTQLHAAAGEPPRLWPVEDEANVDERRAAVGLPPLAMYLRGFGIEYTGP